MEKIIIGEMGYYRDMLLVWLGMRIKGIGFLVSFLGFFYI